MMDRRFQSVRLGENPESLPGDFSADLAHLDREVGQSLRRVDVPVGLAGRVYSASVGFLTPASLPMRTPTVHTVTRQRRTVWARVAVAASLATLCILSIRVVVQNGGTSVPNQPEVVAAQAGLEQPLHDAIEMLLLDRSANRSSEEVAYLFDPDPRESSDMSLYVQTREVTLDDVSVELALLEAELHM